ncbi:MAG: heme lyase CcmF/NrfE family subunit [Actinobacteria bacterium]|nr:MAG: heme lyase CcmF/NrfE family subunit [Actinomycetota bacterium]
MLLSLLGTAGIAAGLAGAILLVYQSAGAARSDATPVALRPATRLLLSGAVVAMFALELALLTNDFSISYVANHHASTTPFPFNVASAWGALEGSIVLWGLVLAGFTWMVLTHYEKTPDRLGAGALAVMGVIAIFFFGLMITVANPFEVCIEAAQQSCAVSSSWPLSPIDAPAEGAGPNPLLQNHILMAVHPPMLYVGYVGLSVPFSYAISALALRVPGPLWLRRSHRSTLVAWSFLTIGIVLGGWWAYEVLSWGGYWAWDPVENASLMPWLVATAFLHSAIVQQRRNMLQAWNFVLVISAFSLTILGTFLTRSGTINSVHSFTQSAIGPALLGFLALIVIGSFILFSARSHLVSSAPRIESFVSREGSFLVNNLLLTLYAFVVLIGTVYPLLVEAFTGTQVGVGAPFYNRLAVPLTFGLLLIMGFGPITPWGSADPALIWRRTRLPSVLALAAGVAVALSVTRVGWVVLAVVLATFVIASIVGLLVEQVARRSTKTGENRAAAVRKIVGGDTAFWAGQLSHIGVVLVAVGIAFASNLAMHDTVTLSPGDTTEFAGYELIYESPFQYQEPQRLVQGARMTVLRDGAFVASMEPTANFYGGSEASGIVTPAVLSRPDGDLYLTLRDLDSTGVTLTLDTSPLIWLLWFGGITAAAGGFWALWARQRDRADRDEMEVVSV